MNLVLEREAPPLNEDETGAVRVGNSRVLLEIVIRALLLNSLLCFSWYSLESQFCFG